MHENSCDVFYFNVSHKINSKYNRENKKFQGLNWYLTLLIIPMNKIAVCRAPDWIGISSRITQIVKYYKKQLF